MAWWLKSICTEFYSIQTSALYNIDSDDELFSGEISSNIPPKIRKYYF